MFSKPFSTISGLRMFCFSEPCPTEEVGRYRCTCTGFPSQTLW